MTKNVGRSVRDRLLQLAKQRGEEFNFVLLRYGLERLLYRLTRSDHSDEFVLKGAMMFTVWSNHPHRATKDLDLLGYGPPDLERLAETFRNVCIAQVEDDGVVFRPETVVAERIKESAEYEGVRVTIDGKLDTARLRLQVDVGFGDAITPEPTLIEFPTLLPAPAPKLRAYPREAVVAEKLHAMVDLGLSNSRMKDFFDLWFLCRTFEFDGRRLREAIRATFERRRTPIPKDAPLALTAEFATDSSKQTQWRAFLSRSRVADTSLTLPEVVDVLAPFMLPELERAADGSQQASRWEPGGPWIVDS